MRRVLVITLAALIAVSAAVTLWFLRDLRAAHDRLAGHSQTIETSEGVLEYGVMGDGPAILAVHGASGGFDQGLDMTRALAQRGYRIIAPSRFGYLRSASPANPTTEKQADAYAQLLDNLGIDKVVLVGISAGAWSSLQFAARHPERCEALVLLVPADYLPEGTAIHGGALVRAVFNSDFVAWAALKLMPMMPGAMSEAMLGTNARVLHDADFSEKARVQDILEHLLPVSARTEGVNFDIKTAAMREPYPLAKIRCPVLTISAEDDRFGTATRARYVAANVPNGRSIIFPTGGHALVGHYADALSQTTSFLEVERQRHR